VARAFDNDVLAQVGEHGGQPVGAHERRDQVVRAGQEQRGAVDGAPGQMLGERPVAVEVPVIVQAAGKTGSLKRPDEHSELLLGQPRPRLDRLRRPPGYVNVAGQERAADIGVEHRVGDAGLLEPDHIEVLAQPAAQHPDGRDRRARPDRHAQPGDRPDPIGMLER
jgi:hypothetical protein